MPDLRRPGARPVVFLAVLTALSVPLLAAHPATAAGPLAVSVSPTQGPPGTSVRVRGTGYDSCPNYGDHRVNILWDGSNTGVSAPIGSDGTFQATFAVPAAPGNGGHLVYGQCVDSGEWARTTFTVAPAPARLTVRVSPARGPSGGRVGVTGAGYDTCPDYGDRQVSVLWDGYTTGITVPIRSDGTFAATLTIPPASAGTHYVYGQCVDGGDNARAAFTVAAPPPNSASPVSSRTPAPATPGGGQPAPPLDGQQPGGTGPGGAGPGSPGQPTSGAGLPTSAAPPTSPPPRQPAEPAGRRTRSHRPRRAAPAGPAPN